MTNHKSKAKEIINKWQSNPKCTELADCFAEGLKEAEISGARKMREKASNLAKNLYQTDQASETEDEIMRLSPESVVEG